MLSLVYRLVIALTTMSVVGILAGLAARNWASATIGMLVCAGCATGLINWLHRYVNSQHDDFLAVLQDTRNSLPSGRKPLMLKSERAADSFGTLADRINEVIEVLDNKLTELRATNRDLEQNKTLFQSILGTMMEGVLVLDSQGRVLYFNRAARQVLDCTTRQVEGRPLFEVVRATDLQAVIDAVRESGTDFRKEIEFKRSKSVVEVTAAQLPLTPEPGVVVVLHEVTELRRLERMRREFVSNVSHELKTPLTSIQIYGDTLLDGGLEDVEHSRTFVTRIIDQSKRLQTLIQDMLRLARIESQSEAFQLETFSVGPVLEECVETRQTIAHSREVELVFQPTQDTAYVSADEGGLRTIIDNLINNAINYTPAGGHIDVRWSCDASTVTIEVADNGIGIPLEDRERIFERFYRVDKARTRSHGGTGLGLAIVKHLAHVFGGEIEVESELGRGSTFRVRLPRQAESSQSLQLVDAEPSADA